MKLKLITSRLPLLMATLAFAAYGFFRHDVSQVFFQEAAAQQVKSHAGKESGKQASRKASVQKYDESPSDPSGESESGDVEKNSLGRGEGLSPENSSVNLRAEENSVSGLALVKRSHALIRDQSFKASIKQRAFIFKKEVVSTGSYLQADGGKGGVRIELDIRTEHLDLKVRLFNDGVYFFRETVDNAAVAADAVNTETGKVKSLSRIESVNLRRMNDQLSKDPHWPGRWIAFGGLYLFMQQTQKCFDFSTPNETTIGDTKVLFTRGTWKPEKLALVLPEQKESILNSSTINLNRIPPQIPIEVELYFFADGKLKDMPRRIVFYRPDSDMANEGKQIPILVTDYVDLQFIDTPEAREFQFSAEKNEVFDITNEFLLEVRK